MPAVPKRPKPIRSLPYRKWVASLGCVLCGGPAQCAHVRYGDLVRGKPHVGGAEKPGDEWSLPLCPPHHMDSDEAQHRMNERRWWAEQGVDPLTVCEQLRDAFPTYEHGWAVVRDVRMAA